MVSTPDLSLESAYHGLVAGIDEAGRGPWAGPVVSAAVVVGPDAMLDGVNDSKKLSAARRERLFDSLLEAAQRQQLWYGIGKTDAPEIDRINILQATICAMQRAFDALQATLPSPACHALVDGNRPVPLPCPVTPVIKGDSISLSIAAASIFAKVTRDRLMRELSTAFPAYGWERNSGYGTKEHQHALAQFGVTEYHRRSYKPIQRYLTHHHPADRQAMADG